MGTYSKAEREKMPTSTFCGPHRSFPIRDQEDVDKAARLIGHAQDPAAVKSCIIRKAKASGWSIPEAWKANMSEAGSQETASVAEFALDHADGGNAEYVEYRGKVFEAGRYPQADFEIEPEELLAAAAEFTGTDNKGAHVPTIFDGKMGRLHRVAVDPEDPFVLNGITRVPRWLVNLHGKDQPLKASLEWDRETKRIVGNTLVPNPLIKDSAMLAAFSETNAEFAKKHNTNTGQWALQSVHDAATRGGAVCKAPGKTANMASSHESSAIQQCHDIATQHGAQCETSDSQGRPLFSEGAGGKKPMSFKDRVIAWFSQGMPDEFEPEAHTPQDPAIPDPALIKLQEEVNQLRKDKQASDAAAFADGEIAASRALPWQRDDLIAEFAEAASDDAMHGIATFSDGNQGNRVDRLRERAARRMPHRLTEQMVREKPDLAVFANQATTPHAGDAKEMSKERREELLKKSTLGQSVISASNNGHGQR